MEIEHIAHTNTESSEPPVLKEKPLEAFLAKGALLESEQLNIIERCLDSGSGEIFHAQEKNSDVFELKIEVRECLERIFSKTGKRVPFSSWVTKNDVRALLKTARGEIATLN